MKGKFTLISMLLLTMFSLAQLNGQSWTVYDGSVLPTDVGFVTSGVAEKPAIISIEDDPEWTGNMVLKMVVDSIDSRYAYRMNLPAVSDSLTLVARIKGVSDTLARVLEIDMDCGASRERLYVFTNGNYRLNQADLEGSLGVNTLDDWHIFRITKDVDTIMCYLDENTVPFVTGVSPTDPGNEYFRFGDGNNGATDEVGGLIDWLIWDTTGIYPPGKGAALPDSISPLTGERPIIAFNQRFDTQRDSDNIQFMRDTLGYNVFLVQARTVAQVQAKLGILNSADLIVQGRSLGSSDFNLTTNPYWWNLVTPPMLILHPYAMRSNNGGYVSLPSGQGAHHVGGNTNPFYGDTVKAVIRNAADPIFAGAPIVNDTMIWSVIREDGMNWDPKTNGDILAFLTYISSDSAQSRKEDSSMLIVRWDTPGTRFYKTAPANRWGAGPRIYFGYGNDESIVHYMSLLPDARQVLANEIDRILNLVYTPVIPSSDATLSAINYTTGTLLPAFAPTTLNYDLWLGEGETTVDVALVRSDPQALISTEGGTIDLSAKDDSLITSVVISSDASDTNTYTVNVHKDTGPAGDNNILFLTNYVDRDSNYINLLEDNGYNVKTWYDANISANAPDSIDMINGYDLVIIGRGTASSAYAGDSKRLYNTKIWRPMMCTHPYAARRGNIGWFSTSGSHHVGGDGNTNYGDTVLAVVPEPADTIFSGVAMINDTNDIDTMLWSTIRDDAFNWDPITNSQVLAINSYSHDGTLLEDSSILISRWDPCVEFFQDAGQGQMAAAPRTYFGFGNDQSDVVHYWCILDDAQAVLLAEINRIMTTPYTICALNDDATLSALGVSVGTLDPGFDPAVLAYSVVVPKETDSVEVTATVNDPNAIVSGTGKYSLATGSATANVGVTAEDGKLATYVVSISVVINTDATLSDLTLDGNTIHGFNPDTLTYDTVLAVGTTAIPVVGATKNDSYAPDPVIVQADSVVGAATVTQTAEDNVTVNVYTVNFSVAVGFNEVANAVYRIYPNPVKNVLRIEGLNDKATVKITNALGQEVLARIAKGSKMELNIQHLDQGVYLMSINNGVSTKVVRLIKE